MSSGFRIAIVLVAVGGLLSPPAEAETFIWVDEAGITHLTDDPEGVPPQARSETSRSVDALRSIWADGFRGPTVRALPGNSSRAADRVLRLLRGAVQNLERGETSRASATLRNVLRMQPGRAEAHWYLAALDRHRGRYEQAESHLQAFLSNAPPEFSRWRAAARSQLADLADERRLADETRAGGVLELLESRAPDFRIQIDAELVAARPGYAEAVLEDLQEARDVVSQQLGVSPLEPLGVVFYGKAAYLRSHAHRFSFRTVGFFDGRIHVVSPAHPGEELRSRLFHEYTHAVYRERTGGDRPYWLNEGLAELVERSSRAHPASTRSERSSLRTRLEAGEWLPLRRLAPSFSGLADADARAAYLESILAASWIEAHSDRQARRLLLQLLGDGFSADQALHRTLGVDTDELDALLRRELRAEFPDR